MPKMLKPVRVIFSLLIFFLFLYVYLDIWTGFSVVIGRYFLDFQFIPSISTTWVSHSLLLGGFIIILISTFLFGRLYCSFLCPLGVIQDIIIYLRLKFVPRRKKKYKILKGHRILRYTVLILVVFTLLGGSMGLLIWLDPYSVSGRMISHLLRPAFYSLFNTSVEGLNKLDYYAILPVDWTFRAHWAFWTIASWTILILILSVRSGRLYCNTLCPVGTLLGLVSRLSLFKIRIDKTSCTFCGKCVPVCKAGCIDLIREKLDFSRCVGCQNCINVCDQNAVQYYLPRGKSFIGEAPVNTDRRNGLGILAGTLFLLPAAIKKSWAALNIVNETPELPKRVSITPPGSLGRAHFLRHCTACHLCVNHCPTQVLQPSGIEISIDSMFQPVMDFTVKYCLYECNVCTQVCPTGAILPLNIEEKKRVQPGRARFIEHLCVVVTKGTLCGACTEHCPTKACDMIPFRDHLMIPLVNNEICVGCGACEHACPTTPKSIVVDENVIHLTAAPPVKKALKPLENKGKEVTEEFPF